MDVAQKERTGHWKNPYISCNLYGWLIEHKKTPPAEIVARGVDIESLRAETLCCGLATRAFRPGAEDEGGR